MLDGNLLTVAQKSRMACAKRFLFYVPEQKNPFQWMLKEITAQLLMKGFPLLFLALSGNGNKCRGKSSGDPLF